MVRRHDAGLAVTRHLGAIDEIHHRIVAPEVEHEAFPGAVVFAVRQAAGAADDRRYIGDLRHARRQLGAWERSFAILCQPPFGKTHQRDHALIGFARIGPETEDAVLDQDQALDRRVGIEDLRRSPGETKARHDVGHIADPLAVDFTAQRFAIGLVGKREDGR